MHQNLWWELSRYEACIMYTWRLFSIHYMANRSPRTVLEQDRWSDTLDGLYSFFWGTQEWWIGDHTSNYCTVAYNYFPTWAWLSIAWHEAERNLSHMAVIPHCSTLYYNSFTCQYLHGVCALLDND